MDLAIMAAMLEEEGLECRIKDYPMERQGWDQFAQDLRDFSPDLLVISTTTPTMNKDLEACALAKQIDPKIKTVAKGAYFLVHDKDILAKFIHLDIVIRGEPEITLKEIIGDDYSQITGITYRRGAEILRNPDRPFLEALDSLPNPARYLLNNSLYRTPDTDEPIAFVITGRGCPGKCIFCAAGLVAGYKLRLRSVDSVVKEIVECVEKYKIVNFFFAADTFTWDKEWVIDFCKAILNKGIKIRWGTNSRVDTLDEERIIWMKKAGCYVVGFGAESASPFMLEKMKKGIKVDQVSKAVSLCRKHRLKSYLHFVIGLPWETKETIDDTIKFVKKTQASFIEVNIAYPLPGTELYTIAKENGLFDETMLSGHDHTYSLIRSFTISVEELRVLRKKILRAFYLRTGYIISNITSMRSPRIVWNYLKYGLRLIKNILTT